MIIYKITNIVNNKVYIGQTRTTLERRMRNHFSLNRKASNCALHNAIRKYGKDKFKIEVLVSAKNLDDLNYLETYFINYFNSLSPNGYNLTTGGDSHIKSEETCKKISNSNKGKPSPMKGRTHTKETRIKMSKPKSEQHRKNLSIAWINKNLKPVVAFNKEESIVFSGIKFTKTAGFCLRNVYKALQIGKPYKGYTFKYFNELEQE